MKYEVRYTRNGIEHSALCSPAQARAFAAYLARTFRITTLVRRVAG